MIKGIETSMWKDFYNDIYNWASNTIFVRDGLYQLGIVLIAFIISLIISKPIRKVLKISINEDKLKNIRFLINFLEPLILPIIFFLAVALAQQVAKWLEWTNPILTIAGSLVGAWIIVQLITVFIRVKVWARLIALGIWIFAALNIMGLLDTLLELLDKLGMDIGEVRVSLLTVIQGSIILFITLWTATKISELVEKRISKSKHLNPSVKVLLSKTFKTLFIFIATVIALNSLGIKLTTFTVFSGAIGVGIGFGLQKNVSNLISGVILLLDKSIKPGDVIEIDNTYGWIKTMSARYVTVITLSGKEHLIPNEDLITQKVVNWSFSDRFIRLDVNVGVSYDTDVPKAMKIMIEAAKSAKRTVKHPEPVCLLNDFGESSLDLQVRFWMKDPENGIDNIKSDVRVEIWKRFKENQISIPFPQRDVHMIQQKEK